MNQDKKKLAILGVLAVVVLGIGAFTMMGGSPAPAPVVETTSTEDASAGTEGTAEGGEVLSEDGTVVAEMVPVLDPVTGEPVIDPETGEPKMEPKKDPNNLLAMVELPQRDPFAPPAGAVLDNTPPPAPAPVEPPRREPEPARPAGNPDGYAPMAPPALPGSLAGGPIGGGDSAPALTPQVPRYRIKGVVIGARPLAVFEDSDGNQKLVGLGGSVDGETTVTGIEKGRVTVKTNGKEKVLVLEEEARND